MVTEKFIEVITKGEQYADNIYNKTKLYIPFLARLCLLSLFIQINFTIFAFRDRIFESIITNSEQALNAVVISMCFIVNTIGCALVLMRKRVPLACGFLYASNIIHWWVMTLRNFYFLTTHISILGGLLVLTAESLGGAKTMFADIPTLDSDKPKSYLKLSGRCLLTLMFIHFLSLNQSFLLVLKDILGCMLMFFVILGYKTKLSVLTMIVYLNFINLYNNDWWMEKDYYRSLYIQHSFFQGISVTGGLLMIVVYGPGGVSLDEAKKRW